MRDKQFSDEELEGARRIIDGEPLPSEMDLTELGRLKLRLSQTYGLTLERFQEMLDEQGGVCAICGGVQDDGRPLDVDHSHKTSRVRALLCHRCNIGLGNFGDDPELLRKAVAYLEKHRARGAP